MIKSREVQEICTELGNPRDALIVGGCGFIGGHFVDRLLKDRDVEKVTVYDNLSSGNLWHLEGHKNDARLKVIISDVREFDRLVLAASGHTTLIHLASNPDIAAAAIEPAIDFDQGTLLTHNVAEAARIAGIKTVLYASGSGVYGDIGIIEADECYGPLHPISTYAASKLAGESLLCSYAHMFGIRAIAFRFGNVVGPRQTHGVGFDFVRQLAADPTVLRILGDGQQSKSYVYVTDVLAAVLMANAHVVEPYSVFNVATGDYVCVTEIADLACQALEIDHQSVEYIFSGGRSGWKGDVPIVRLSSERIRALGWNPQFRSKEAILNAMISMSLEPRTLC